MSLSSAILSSFSPTAFPAALQTLISPHASPFLLIENQQRHPRQRSR
jgi:hypothetical protein